MGLSSLGGAVDAEGWKARIESALAENPGLVADSSTFPCRCRGGWIVSDYGGEDGVGFEALPCSSCRPVLYARWEAEAETDSLLGSRNHLDHSRTAGSCDECQSIAAVGRPGGTA